MRNGLEGSLSIVLALSFTACSSAPLRRSVADGGGGGAGQAGAAAPDASSPSLPEAGADPMYFDAASFADSQGIVTDLLA